MGLSVARCSGHQNKTIATEQRFQGVDQAQGKPCNRAIPGLIPNPFHPPLALSTTLAEGQAGQERTQAKWVEAVAVLDSNFGQAGAFGDGSESGRGEVNEMSREIPT